MDNTLNMISQDWYSQYLYVNH